MSSRSRIGRRRLTTALVVALALVLLLAGCAAEHASAADALQSAGESARQRAGGTWRELFSSDGRGPLGMPAALAWLVVLELCALAAIPITAFALRRLPDRGYALTKPLGLLVVAYPVWLGASLGLFSFSRAAFAMCAALLLTAAAVVAWRARDSLAGALRTHWRQIVAVELLFAGAFIAVYALRTGNPDLFHPYRGGEKHMDLAHLTAVMKSTSMPPYDPWFAGGQLNYYYFGHVLTAGPAKALRIAPEVAYNLAVATFAAFMAVAAYSLARNLAVLTIRARPSGRHAGRAPSLAGLLAVVLVLLAGNLDGALQWYDHVRQAGGLWDVVVRGAKLSPFDYWSPSRAIHDSYSVTEFPAFTVLLGDLHAHLMAMPYAMTAASASLAVFVGSAARERGREAVAALLLAGLLVGTVRAMNTWDLPTQAVLATLAVAAGALLAHGFGRTAALDGGWRLALVGVTAWLTSMPFAAHFSHAGKLGPTPETTPVSALLVHFGMLLALALGLLGTAPFASLRARLQTPGAGVLMGLAAAGLLALAVTDRPAALVLLALLVALVGAAVLATDRPRDEGLLAALGLAVVAIAILVGVELINVRPDLARMNTVFKFWLQAWWLLALAAAYAAWRGLALGPAAGWPRRSWTVLVVAGLCAALVYPIKAVPVRLDDRIVTTAATADGIAYMKTARYSDDHGSYRLDRDLAMIDWVRAHVDGSPAIIEAVTPLYRWGSRISVYTGLPAVIGWDYHEKQQRDADQAEVDRRIADVAAFYSTADRGLAGRILARYDVRYVFVGELERAYYPAAGVAKIARLPGLERVYESGNQAIYRRRANAPH